MSFYFTFVKFEFPTFVPFHLFIIHLGFPCITRHMFVTLLYNLPPLCSDLPHLHAVPLYSWATAWCIKLSLPPSCSTHPFSSRQSRSRQAWVIHWAILPLALSWPIYFTQRWRSLHHNQPVCFANCSPEFLILACSQTAGQRGFARPGSTDPLNPRASRQMLPSSSFKLNPYSRIFLKPFLPDTLAPIQNVLIDLWQLMWHPGTPLTTSLLPHHLCLNAS